VLRDHREDWNARWKPHPAVDHSNPLSNSELRPSPRGLTLAIDAKGEVIVGWTSVARGTNEESRSASTARLIRGSP